MTRKEHGCRQWIVAAFAEEPGNTDENVGLKFDKCRRLKMQNGKSRNSQLH